jgi:hypothetical protein
MPEGIPTPEKAPASVSPVERLRTPEIGAETPSVEQRPRVEAMPVSTPVDGMPAPISKGGAPAIDPVLQEVEDILSEGLEDAYATMDPLAQKEFREEGERTARIVRDLLAGAKVKIQNILKIIKRWLVMIPGVSKLFLEQEAKIKTDRLMALRRRERGEEELR